MHQTKPPTSYLPQMIASGVISSALATPHKIALAEGDRFLSYQELVRRMHQVAGAATQSGFGHGDRVAVISPNCLEYPEIVLGLSLIGVQVVLINPKLTSTEIAFILDDSAAIGIIAHSSIYDGEITRLSKIAGKIILIGDDYDQWRQSHGHTTLNLHRIEEWETFALAYTAGTTGKPKGVMLSHRSRVLTFLSMSVAYGCYSPDDRSLALAPMYHGAGFAFAIAPIFFGGFVEILPKFDPEIVLSKLSDTQLTNTFMVPTHFNAIFGLSPQLRQRYRFDQLKTIISNAAPLPQATKEKIVDYFGSDVLHETYGSTEAGIVTNLRPSDQLRKMRCVGLPFPLTRVELRDNDGLEVGVGEVGELFSYSPYLFNGYWNNPEATSETFADGWASVGDLAIKDDEGYFYIVDRKKDVIISGGINIYPREIEEVLHAHPSVAEAAVVGEPDDYWGETAKAFVVLKPGTHLTSEELSEHCRKTLAGFKIPKHFEWPASLPRNAAGKVLKRELRDAV